MAIPAQKKGVLRRDCSSSNKNSSLKVAYANNEATEKTKSVSRPAVCIPTAKPALLLYLTPGLQLPVSSGSSDILLSKQLSFNLTVPFNQ